MFLIVAKYLIPRGYRGLAIFPFVLVKQPIDKNNQILLSHERIHLQQQIELLILPFFVWYIIEFAYRWLQFKNWNMAYRNISFEREAYANEKNEDYLKQRNFWEFLRWIR
jgi:hypothetical protein